MNWRAAVTSLLDLHTRRTPADSELSRWIRGTRTEPCDPDPTLVAATRAGLDEVTAVLREVLRRCPAPSQQTRVLLGLADPDTLPPAEQLLRGPAAPDEA